LSRGRGDCRFQAINEVVFLVFSADDSGVGDVVDVLLSTGEVARLLGVSRQHVVDLCSRGELPFVSVGSHRRVRRSVVKQYVGESLSREGERSLWLHRAVAGRMVLDPERVMSRARRNLDRLQRTHPDGMSAAWLANWSQVLDRGVDAVLDVLTSRSGVAVELRQNSPFAGVLTQRDRDRVLAAFREHWRVEHTAAAEGRTA
jgi:excisionase family DNA binding protein